MIRVKKNWIKVLLTCLIVMILIFTGSYFFIKKEIKYRYYFNKNEIYYVYDPSKKLEVVYGVRNHNQIDHLLSYYNWKLNGAEYTYDDLSIIRKLPFNTTVYPQKYLRDSTVVYVAFKHFNSYKKDSVIWNYYIPKSMLHKKPICDK